MSNNEKFIPLFEKAEALLTGHFLLTSGKHSNRYIQCAKVLQYPSMCVEICQYLAEQIKDKELDVIIAPAMGGILVGFEMGVQLNKKAIFTERVNGKMELRRSFEIQPGDKVLIAEDVITTGGSVFEVMDLVKEKGGIVIGVVSLVDRSAGRIKFGVPFVSAISLDVITYESDSCPLCAEGKTPAIKPGSRTLNS
ncbi:MAG: orotate phosphoribosyltransferase [Clostridia bacterium]